MPPTCLRTVVYRSAYSYGYYSMAAKLSAMRLSAPMPTTRSNMSPEEKIALLERLRSKWTAIGLSTEVIDRPRTERAINSLYLNVPLPPPSIGWLRSPLEAFTRYSGEGMHLGESIVSRLPKVGIANLSDADGPVVWKWAQFYTIRVYEAYGNAASDDERRQYDDFGRGVAMAEKVTAAVWTHVGKLIDEAARFSATFANGSLNTGTQLGDLAFHEWWWTYRGKSLADHPVAPLIELGEAAGWTLPFRNECWVIERPASLVIPDEGQSRGSAKMTARFGDGFSAQ